MIPGSREQEVRAHAPLPGRVLVVSEDPSFIERMRSRAKSEGRSVVACLGPAASPCFLDEKGSCPLAGRSAVVVVDAPESGVFRYHLREVAAADYAERLQNAHPHTHVALVNAGGRTA